MDEKNIKKFTFHTALSLKVFIISLQQKYSDHCVLALKMRVHHRFPINLAV